MCLVTSNNLISTKSRSSGQRPKQTTRQRHFFPTLRPLSPEIFGNCNSGGICIASQFFPQPSLPFSRPLNKISYLVAQDDIFWRAVREPLHTGIRAHTSIMSSWIHLILSSNQLRKVKTLLQDSFQSWHPATTTQHLRLLETLRWLPIWQNVSTIINIRSLVCVSVL